MRASTARWRASRRRSTRWSANCSDGALFGGRLDNLELKFSHAAAMPFQRLKIRLKKEIVTLGDPHGRSDPAGRNLCRACRLERADRGAGHAGDRHPQRLRGGDGHALPARSIRSIKSFGQFKDFVARQLDPAEAPQDRDVLHRRHPLREGQCLSAVARLCRGLSSQGRHPEISGRACRKPKAAGAANVSCSTNASRSATDCASARRNERFR